MIEYANVSCLCLAKRFDQSRSVVKDDAQLLRKHIKIAKNSEKLTVPKAATLCFIPNFWKFLSFLCGLHNMCSNIMAPSFFYLFVHESRAPITWSSNVVLYGALTRTNLS